MKKFVNIVLGVAAAMGLSSCEAFFTREPINEFSAETYFSTEAELKMYTDGFINSWMPDYSEPASGDMFNDLIATKNSTGYLTEGSVYNAAKRSAWSFAWLRRINFMLEGMAKNGQNIPEAIYKHYEGVARFWRAYQTCSMIKTYGNIPWTKAYLQPDDPALYGERMDREEVFNEVVADLEFALEHVSADAQYLKGQVYINKYVVGTFASRAYLYEASFRSNYDKNPSTQEPWKNNFQTPTKLYELAAKAAKVVIDSKAYKLAPSASYPDLFLSPTLNTDEVIWGLTADSQVYGVHALTRYYYSDSMGDTPSATKEMVNMFLKADGTPVKVLEGEGAKSINEEFANRDKRLSWTVLGPGYKVLTSGEMKLMPMECNYSMTGYMLVKWLMPNRVNFLSGQDNNSILVFRYPEVLLNYAEAMNELGKMNQTIWNETVGLLRERAGVKNIYPTEADPWLKQYYTKDLMHPFKTNGNEAVALELRRERVTELILEGGLRQYDLYRYAQMDLCERRGLSGEEAWTGIWLSEADYQNGFTFQGQAYKFGPDQKTESWSYAISTSKANGTWSVQPANGGYYLMFHYDLRWQDVMYVYPISQTDLNLIWQKNPEFKQNVGWENGIN